MTKTQPQEDEILTIQEVAKLLKLPTSTAYKLAKEEELPMLKIGRHWRCRKDTLMAWIEKQAPKP